MGSSPRAFSKSGFAKTFVLPGLLIFLVPVISLFFFRHAERTFDANMRASVVRGVQEDKSLSLAERERAVAFFNEHPFSELITSEELGANFDKTTRFHFATFRWLFWLSAIAIGSGVAVFGLAGMCVWLSRGSQRAQYLSLSAGWQVLRFFGALQVIAQGVMLLALSFWITALWFNFYSIKLIVCIGIFVFLAAGAVIVAVFKRPKSDHVVEGNVLERGSSPRLWNELRSICEKVGTAEPDQVIVGIDDNFFVTETPVTVGGVVYQGRTLYVSLSLLKQMYGAEADAVLAHEMAHFSGNDTLYSKKISPLLLRFDNYLQALYNNPATRLIFHFMHFFRALFELSLREHGRQREFRADRIASEATSSRHFASALVRISAYSDFRGKIQQDLFKQERALETADISAQIEQGFHAHARSFVAAPDMWGVETSHPFDSHPPLWQRLDSIGIPLTSEEVRSLVGTAGDGRWYERVEGAEEIERQLWNQFEEGFRNFHEQSLAYRFLPETDEERGIVAKSFPELTFESKQGSLVLDCESIRFTTWSGGLLFGEISNMTLKDGTLQIHCAGGGKQKVSVPMKTFGNRQQEALQAIQLYYGRHLSAVAYQQEKQAIPTEC